MPFPRDSELATLWAHMRADPPRASELGGAAVDRVVERALAKDPQERYASGGELVRAARDALGLSEVRVVRQRAPLLLLAAGAVIVAVAAAAAFAVSGGGDSATALRGNTLVRIDPTTNSVSEVIDVGDKPSAVAVAGRTAWVYNLGDGTVSQIDTSTNSVRRTTPISVVPVHYAYQGRSSPRTPRERGSSASGGTGREYSRVGMDGSRQEFPWTPGLSQ